MTDGVQVEQIDQWAVQLPNGRWASTASPMTTSKAVADVEQAYVASSAVDARVAAQRWTEHVRDVGGQGRARVMFRQCTVVRPQFEVYPPSVANEEMPDA